MKLHYTRPEKIRAYAKQVAFIDAPTPHAIIEATSKAGKTVGCIVWLFECALLGERRPPTLTLPPVGEGDQRRKSRNKNAAWPPPLRGEDRGGGQTQYLPQLSTRHYWWVAPTVGVAKIAFRRMKRYIQPKTLYTTNETELTITLVNGAVIQFKSADNPDALYGEDVHAAVLDESTRMKEDAYIAVDSTLTATRGAMRIIGNVKGTGNWAYKLARRVEAGDLPDWTYYKLTAGDAVEAGVLSQEMVDEKRSRLPLGTFLELYYAIPNVSSSSKFAFAFSKEKHVAPCTIDYRYPIWLSFDFNKNPICCAVIQYFEGVVRIPMVVKLENSDIYRLCAVLKGKLAIQGPHLGPPPVGEEASGRSSYTQSPLMPSSTGERGLFSETNPAWPPPLRGEDRGGGHFETNTPTLQHSNIFNPDLIIVNGDASGAAGSAMVRDDMNYFRIIKEELGLGRGQMQQLASNPRIEQNQVLVNAVLEHIPHRIDPGAAAALIFDLEFAEMLPDGTLRKADREDPTQQLDALDCYRYWCNRNMRGVVG